MKKDKQFYIERAKKGKENKQKLVQQIADMMVDDVYNYQDVIKDLIIESLQKNSQTTLKEQWLC